MPSRIGEKERINLLKSALWERGWNYSDIFSAFVSNSKKKMTNFIDQNLTSKNSDVVSSVSNVIKRLVQRGISVFSKRLLATA